MIADGFHLPDAVLRAIARTKGADRLLLISDLSPAGGLPPGRHQWGRTAVELHADGRISLAGTPYLAGAGHLLNHSIPLFARATGWSLSEAVRLATESPERFLGLRTKPSGVEFATGEPCDVVVFSWNPAVGPLQIRAVYCPERFYDGAHANTVLRAGLR